MANKYVDDIGGATDDQTEAEAFIAQMSSNIHDPSVTAPMRNPNNDNNNAGKGSATFGAIPDSAKPKSL